MKTLFCLLLALTPFLSFSKNTPGYIVNLNHDTIEVEIVGESGKSGRTYFSKVWVKHASGEEKAYTPDDLIAIGYMLDRKWPLIYRSKPMENGKKQFLFLNQGGTSSSLYSYSLADTSPGMKKSLVYYTLENIHNEYIFLTNFENVSSVKAKLARFYQNNPEAVKFLTSSFRSKGKIEEDIKSLVKLANS